MNPQPLPLTAPASCITPASSPAAMLHLVFGPQGAGKSTLANDLARQHQGVCLAIDPWMADLYGPDMAAPLDFARVMQRVRRCEGRIWTTAVAVASQGMNVVLDEGCMKVADRRRFSELAQQALLPLQMHFVTADAGIRRQRVLLRNTQRGDTFAFPVSPVMFDQMEGQFEAPSADELACAIVLNT